MVKKKRDRSVKLQRSSLQRSRSLQQRPNVWVVLSVALLVMGLTVISLLSSSSITGNTVQDIGRMNKGDPLHLSIRDVPGIESVFTNADEIIQHGKIIVEVDESIFFEGIYVSKFTVSSENKFGPLRFTFKVNE